MAMLSYFRGKIEYLSSRGIHQFDIDKRFWKVDSSSLDECRKVTAGFDTIVHFADIVVAGIEFVFGNELFIYRQNMLINTNSLTAAIENGIGKYLYVVTACSYPAEKQSTLSGMPRHTIGQKDQFRPDNNQGVIL